MRIVLSRRLFNALAALTACERIALRIIDEGKLRSRALAPLAVGLAALPRGLDFKVRWRHP